MNKKTPPPYSTFPSSAKSGILFLWMGWIWHFSFLYLIFGGGLDRNIWLQQSAIALLVCFFTLRVRNWARVLGIVANLLIISVYLLLAAHFYSLNRMNFFVFSAMNVVFFSLSTFFLFKRETADFFKLHSPRLGEKKTNEK